VARAVGAVVTILLLAGGAAGRGDRTYDPLDTSFLEQLKAPDLPALLGTDAFGARRTLSDHLWVATALKGDSERRSSGRRWGRCWA